MSLAKLHVWVSATGRLCELATTEFYVYILGCCDFKVLEWCGKKYAHDRNDTKSDWMRTKCGQLELELPPGCYIVGAVRNPFGYEPLGNHLTHIAVVRLNCGDEACVTLFDSSLHVCATWLGAAVNSIVGGGGGGGIDLPDNAMEALRNAGKALQELTAVLKPDPFSAATLAIAQAAGPPKGPRKTK